MSQTYTTVLIVTIIQIVTLIQVFFFENDTLIQVYIQLNYKNTTTIINIFMSRGEHLPDPTE